MLLQHRAGFQRDLGLRDSAIVSFKECLAFMESRFGADPFNIAVVKKNFGETAGKQSTIINRKDAD